MLTLRNCKQGYLDGWAGSLLGLIGDLSPAGELRTEWGCGALLMLSQNVKTRVRYTAELGVRN